MEIAKVCYSIISSRLFNLCLFLENNSPKTIDIPKLSSEKEHSDLLISRNRQLENDLQRLELQQRNNQLALERLDECEETICQLQEELDQLRSNKKKQSSRNKII